MLAREIKRRPSGRFFFAPVVGDFELDFTGSFRCLVSELIQRLLMDSVLECLESRYRLKGNRVFVNQRFIWLTLKLLVLAGCAADPIVDQRGIDPEQYALDIAECQGYADQVDTSKEVAKQAGLTGLVGGVLAGAFEHGRGVRGVEEGVGAGATIGAARGVGKATSKKERVMNQCMRARGYIVYD